MQIDLDQQIAGAEAKQASLERDAEDATAEATRAAKAYEAHRDAKLLVASQVARDLAADAAVAVTAHKSGTVEPLRAQKRQQEREALATERNQSVASILDDLRSAEDAIVAGVKAYDAAISRLAAEHYPRVQAQQAGCSLPGVSLERLVTETNARLAPLRGQNSLHTTDAAARFIAANNDSNVRFEFTRPAGHVPSPLR